MMDVVTNETVEELSDNLEEISHRLEGIEHYLQMIAEYGVLSREVEEAIVYLTRHFSKELDERYKQMLNQEAGKV